MKKLNSCRLVFILSLVGSFWLSEAHAQSQPVKDFWGEIFIGAPFNHYDAATRGDFATISGTPDVSHYLFALSLAGYYAKLGIPNFMAGLSTNIIEESWSLGDTSFSVGEVEFGLAAKFFLMGDEPMTGLYIHVEPGLAYNSISVSNGFFSANDSSGVGFGAQAGIGYNHHFPSSIVGAQIELDYAYRKVKNFQNNAVLLLVGILF